MSHLELFGYLSMIIVLISMTLRDMVTLRVVNTIGCAMFVVYGFFLGSYPVQVMNILVIMINIYYIYYHKK